MCLLLLFALVSLAGCSSSPVDGGVAGSGAGAHGPFGGGGDGAADSGPMDNGGESRDSGESGCQTPTTDCLIELTFAELLRFDQLACPCEPSGQSEEACLADTTGQSPEFERCAKAFVTKHSSQALLAELECTVAAYRARNQCISDAACDPVARGCELPACEVPTMDALQDQLKAECEH
jgi:hypothetical protein